MREIELKLLLDKAAAGRIWPRAIASGMADCRPKPKTLRTIYFDTDDHRLHDAGISLRLRHDAGRWRQTVKIRDLHFSGLSDADEFESDLTDGELCLNSIPDKAVRRKIKKVANGAALIPVCETLINRTEGPVTTAGKTLAMLAVDSGKIVAGDHSAKLFELEIELKEGPPAGLFDIGLKLLPQGGVTFSDLSKAGRGYLLAQTGSIQMPLLPRNANSIAISAREDADLVAQNILRDCASQIAANINVVASIPDIEGPHQLRIGLRRLRSAFSILSPVLDCPAMRHLGEEAVWLGREVGKLRDLDVVLKDIVARESAAHPEDAGLAHIMTLLNERCEFARTRLRGILEGKRTQSFIFDLMSFVETRAWNPEEKKSQYEQSFEIMSFASSALDKRWKRIGKWISQRDLSSVDDCHRLRKKLKRLRYAIEFLAPLFPRKMTDRYLVHLKRLQTLLGDLNDATMFKTMDLPTTLAEEGNAELQQATGWILGASQVRAELALDNIRKEVKKLKKAKPFWK